MGRLWVGAAVVLLIATVGTADTGQVRRSETVGPYVITVFSAPTPPRVGPFEVTVLVQDAAGGASVTDARVVVTVVSLFEAGLSSAANASHERAGSAELYGTLFDLPLPGEYSVESHVHAGSTEAALNFTFVAEPPPSAWQTFWPYFALPPAAVALFALHQWLKRRR